VRRNGRGRLAPRPLRGKQRKQHYAAGSEQRFVFHVHRGILE
jgi:hypothetical protein